MPRVFSVKETMWYWPTSIGTSMSWAVLAEVCGEHRPGVIGDAGVGVELVDGAEHCGLQLGPSLRLGAALDPGDLPF